MPYVNIKITQEGATAEQKARLIQGVTELLRDTLGKNPQTTVVVIEELPTDNWSCPRITGASAGKALPSAAVGVVEARGTARGGRPGRSFGPPPPSFLPLLLSARPHGHSGAIRPKMPVFIGSAPRL